MADNEFSATVSRWVRQTERRQLAVFRESVQRLMSIAQKPVGEGGNMPVVTGFLRASADFQLNAPITGTIGNESGGVPLGAWEPRMIATLANCQIGDVIHIAWRANYAVHVNYGANGRQGYHFAESAVKQWPQIVNGVINDLRARSG